MAIQSHYQQFRPLMSYNGHSQQKNRSTRFNGLVQLSPVGNATCFGTRTVLPVRWITGRSRQGVTTFSGLGSINQIQSLSTTDVVVSVLRGWWIAVTLAISIASIPLAPINAFHHILLRLSERGKSSSKSRVSVPKKFFGHFYVLGAIWTTFLLVATWMYAFQTAPIWNSVFLLLLMEAQVLCRLFESVFVFKYSPSARMHLVGYLYGLLYYLAAPLSLCCMFSLELFEFVRSWFAEFVVKGMQFAEFDLSPLLQLKWCAWIGAAVFWWGWIHQRRCHAILGSLRDNKGKEDDYVIPHGDWFEYVSSPHYLAEIVMYGGLVIASGCSDITIWLLFGTVVANLAFTAAQTHKWYIGKFKNYPKSRYAIIPFIY